MLSDFLLGRISFSFWNVILFRVILTNVRLLSGLLLNAILHNIFLQSFITTSVTQLSVILLFLMGLNDIILSIILPLSFWQYHSIVILSFSWVLSIEWHSLQHLYTMCHSPQCHSTVCRSTECRGAAITEQSQSSEWVCVANKNKMKGCKTSQTRGQFENKKIRMFKWSQVKERDRGTNIISLSKAAIYECS